MKREDKIFEIINTTDDTFVVYKKIASKCLKHDLEIINNVLSKLSPQELLNKYFKSENEDGSFNYQYEKDLDDVFINKRTNTKPLVGEMYANIAALNWIERKMKELEQIKNNLADTERLYPTLKTNLTSINLTRIFKLLKESGWIDKSTNKDIFDLALSGNEIHITPQIIFLKQKQHLAYLIEKLKLTNGHYSQM